MPIFLMLSKVANPYTIELDTYSHKEWYAIDIYWYSRDCCVQIFYLAAGVKKGSIVCMNYFITTEPPPFKFIFIISLVYIDAYIYIMPFVGNWFVV